MRTKFSKSVIAFCAMIMSFQSYSQFYCNSNPVDVHGGLSVSGNRIVDQNDEVVSFAGNSMFWSNEFFGAERFYNANVVSSLKEDWGATIVRAAMGVEDFGGFLTYPNENRARVQAVVDAAIAEGMYVIIDWHSHSAENERQAAIDFFKEMATLYGDHPNVIYELYNEPVNSDWSNDIKPYAEAIISEIRAIDPDNLIIVGTPFYSQNVDVASNDPITSSDNIAYTLHFYAGTHGASLRSRAQTALNNGIALMVTEWGTVNADGNGGVNESSTNEWMQFLEENDISHLNWSVHDKVEGASILQSGASSNGNWPDSSLTASGLFVRNIIQNWEQHCGNGSTTTVVENSLTVSDLSDFDSEGASQSITITSNVDWSVSENVNWISVDTTSGSNNGSVTCTASENISTNPRSAVISISGGGITQTVTVSQVGAEVVNSLNVSSLSDFDSEGSSQTITITSNTDWTVNENANWISVNRTSGSNNGSVTCTTSRNTSTNPRSATISISGGGITQSMTVSQVGAEVVNSLSASSLSDFDSEGASQSITVTSNVDWAVSENADWISVNRTNGSDNGSFTCTASENTSTSPRSATINISGGGITRIVTVNQEATPSILTASSLSTDFSSEGGAQTVVITSNIDWRVLEETDWINVNTTSGSDNGSVSITASPNTSTDSRTAVVTISGGTGFKQFIAVNQDALAIVVEEEEPVVIETPVVVEEEEPVIIEVPVVVEEEEPVIIEVPVVVEEEEPVIIEVPVVVEEEEPVIIEVPVVEEPTIDGNTSSVDCGAIQGWNSTDIYSEAGTQVVYNGTIYENKWYTLNQNPEDFSEFSYSLWTILGSCDGTETVTEEIVNSSNCGGIPTWNSTDIYSEADTQVYYNGVIYENKWYTRNQNPEAFSEHPWSLWTVLGTCDSTADKSLNNDIFGVISYPNPFTNTINITAEGTQEIGSLQLVDLSGRIVAVENGTSINNLEAIADGMYLVQILNTNNEIIAVEKVVKK